LKTRTKDVYIIHGCAGEDEYFNEKHPSPSNSHWLPWLQKSLLLKGYPCQTPEMPAPYKPSYSAWKETFDPYPVSAETTLVAHSCGSGFLLRWLGENKKSIHKLVMVAPWLDPERLCGDFLKFTPDPALQSRVGEIHVLYSSDEPIEGVKESVDLILKTWPSAQLHQFEGMGHFCRPEMKTVEFPALLEIVTK
jgi:predicted alpha/beta hydrolase family esterase